MIDLLSYKNKSSNNNTQNTSFNDNLTYYISMLISYNDCIAFIFKLINKWDLAEDFYYNNIELSRKINNDKWLGKNKLNFADVLRNKGFYKESMVYLKSAYDIFVKISYQKGMIVALRYMGLIQLDNNNLNEAITIQNHALDIASKSENYEEINQILNITGKIYSIRGETKKAIEQFLEMNKLCKSNNDLMGLANSQLNLGVINLNSEDYKNAIKHFKKSLRISDRIRYNKGILISLSNIGLILRMVGKYKSSLGYFNRNLKLAKEISSQFNIGLSIGNLGIIYYKKRLFKAALEYFNKAIDIFNNMNDSYHSCVFIEKIAEMYFQLGNYNTAGYYNIEALRKSEHIGREDVYFHSLLLNTKLISHKDKNLAIEKLKVMLNDYHENFQKAYILFELYNMTNNIEYGKRAYTMFKNLYEKVPIMEYKNHIKILLLNKRIVEEEN